MATRADRWVWRAAVGWLPAAVAIAAIALSGAPLAAGAPPEESKAIVRVAAAANVEKALDELAAAFAQIGAYRLDVSAGATGKLTTQITQGAPFDVLLAADEEHPKLLEDKGLAEKGSRFTYARGRLVLWGTRGGQELGPRTLREGRFAHLAIADPAVAPYGAAAVATLRKLGVYAAIEPKLVRGESVGQAFAFVQSGAAELGFVALSQLADVGSSTDAGSRWLVPEELHPPLLQQAVLLAPGRENAAARAFLRFLAADPAKAILRRYGYTVP